MSNLSQAPTVSLKETISQKDVPHHDNTAGNTRNTSSSSINKSNYLIYLVSWIPLNT